MTNEPLGRDEQVDQALRDAFVVVDDVAERVSDHALAAPLRHRLRASLLAPLALAAVTLCVVAVVWLSRPPVHPSARARDAMPRQAVATTPIDTELTGSLVDGVLTISIPGDGLVIAGTGRRSDRPPDGSGVVLVEGVAR